MSFGLGSIAEIGGKIGGTALGGPIGGMLGGEVGKTAGGLLDGKLGGEKSEKSDDKIGLANLLNFIMELLGNSSGENAGGKGLPGLNMLA
jgi:hypothetical protein